MKLHNAGKCMITFNIPMMIMGNVLLPYLLVNFFFMPGNIALSGSGGIGVNTS